MSRIWLISIGGVLALLVMGAVQFLFPRTAMSPAPIVSEPLAPIENNSASSSTPSLDVKKVTISSPAPSVPERHSIAKGDTVASWSFKGAYADNPELLAKAQAEITRLTELLGKGTYPDVSLYVGIANQYDLLGDGKSEYDSLVRAIGEGGETTGLPWHNLGVLMEKLGALETARVAYEKSTLIQPQMKFYHYAYFEFLTTRMKENGVAIEKEYTAALKNLGQDSDILQLYAEWKQV